MASAVSVVEPAAMSCAWLELAVQVAGVLGAPTLVLGSGDDAHLAMSMGAAVPASAALPLGSLALGRRSVRAQLGPHLAGRRAVAWSPRAAQVAIEAARQTVLVAHAVHGELGARAGAVTIQPWDEQSASGWIARGGFRVLAPLMALPQAHTGPGRAQWRERWGLSASAMVVGLIGGPPALQDALLAVDIVGRATLACGNGAQEPLVLMVPPDAANVDQAAEWAGGSPHLVTLMCDPRAERVQDVAAGLDCALMAPTVPGVEQAAALDAYLLARMGVPVVAPDECAAAALVGAAAGRSFPLRRSTLAARCVAAAIAEGPLSLGRQRAIAAPLPGPDALAERLAERSAATA